MSPETVDVLQRSLTLVARQRVSAGTMFYDRLFELAPELRSMFRSDLTSQAGKLVDTIALCIGQLNHPEIVALTLTSLGERHTAYGVRREHYEVVGAALLWMLGKVLRTAFTPEVEAAWSELYQMTAAAMTAPLGEDDASFTARSATVAPSALAIGA